MGCGAGWGRGLREGCLGSVREESAVERVIREGGEGSGGECVL